MYLISYLCCFGNYWVPVASNYAARGGLEWFLRHPVCSSVKFWLKARAAQGLSVNNKKERKPVRPSAKNTNDFVLL